MCVCVCIRPEMLKGNLRFVYTREPIPDKDINIIKITCLLKIKLQYVNVYERKYQSERKK